MDKSFSIAFADVGLPQSKYPNSTLPGMVFKNPAKADRSVFSDNMKWLIHDSKLSVDQLCKDLNLSKHRVNRWLTGVCYPTNEVMVQLCHYFRYYDIFALLTRRFD